MNIDRALAHIQLGSRLADERIEAATFFVQSGTPDDLDLLRRAHRLESVPWVSERFAEAIARITEAASVITTLEASAESPAEVTQPDVAMFEATSQLLHEIEPVLGYIRYDAERAIPEYPKSQTAQSIDHLASILIAISTLRKAASRPVWNEFDLSESVKSATPRGSEEMVLVAGKVPTLVVGDKNLIHLALKNGLRNAVEACMDITDAKVIVNWGASTEQFWCSIIDEGIGFSGNVDGAFRTGRTTKDGHLGWGLPTARQAMTSQGGEVTLCKEGSRGSRFEIRWPRNPL